MQITSSFLGTKIDGYNYLFFWVTQDYIEEHNRITQDLDPLLKIFARNINKSGVLVRPWQHDANITRDEIVNKNWDIRGLELISKTPGILILDTDFDDFDPKTNPWAFLSFRDSMDQNAFIRIWDIQELLAKLGRACLEKKDIFKTLSIAIKENRINNLVDAIEIKPGFFGISFDVKKGLQILENLFETGL